MKCPKCSRALDAEEREDCFVGPRALERIFDAANPRDTRIIRFKIPAARYRCAGCETEFLWIKGVKGLRILGEPPESDVAVFIERSDEHLVDALLEMEIVKDGFHPEDDPDDN